MLKGEDSGGINAREVGLKFRESFPIEEGRMTVGIQVMREICD
jgi:hypothetical protein